MHLPGILRRSLLSLAAVLMAVATTANTTSASANPALAPLPEKLSAAGLYLGNDPARIDPAHLAFSPQFPLWSDGTRKQRWLSLPAGQTVDARDPNAWQFPPGTRLWKTFGYARPIETRMIERLADGSWRFSAYVWDEDGRDATLAPAQGIAAVAATGAPGGTYRIPSREDCEACHTGNDVPVLGFSLAQLPNVAELTHARRLVGLPETVLEQAPALPAAGDVERAALGYLHGNCGYCHNRSGRGVPVALNLSLRWREGALDSATVLRSLLGRQARYAAAGSLPGTLVVAGDAAASLLPQRMRSRDPRLQMPPLGTHSVDEQGLALIESWIASLPKKETTP